MRNQKENFIIQHKTSTASTSKTERIPLARYITFISWRNPTSCKFINERENYYNPCPLKNLPTSLLYKISYLSLVPWGRVAIHIL